MEWTDQRRQTMADRVRERERIQVRNALQMHALIEAWQRTEEGRRKYAAYRRRIWDVPAFPRVERQGAKIFAPTAREYQE